MKIRLTHMTKTDILVIPIPDSGVTSRVFRAVQSYAGLYRHEPPFREHPRIAVADTKTVCPAVITLCAAAEVIAHIGELPADEVSHKGFIEPVAAAELHGVEVHRE